MTLLVFLRRRHSVSYNSQSIAITNLVVRAPCRIAKEVLLEKEVVAKTRKTMAFKGLR